MLWIILYESIKVDKKEWVGVEEGRWAGSGFPKPLILMSTQLSMTEQEKQDRVGGCQAAKTLQTRDNTLAPGNC